MTEDTGTRVGSGDPDADDESEAFDAETREESAMEQRLQDGQDDLGLGTDREPAP